MNDEPNKKKLKASCPVGENWRDGGNGGKKFEEYFKKDVDHLKLKYQRLRHKHKQLCCAMSEIRTKFERGDLICASTVSNNNGPCSCSNSTQSTSTPEQSISEQQLQGRINHLEKSKIRRDRMLRYHSETIKHYIGDEAFNVYFRAADTSVQLCGGHIPPDVDPPNVPRLSIPKLLPCVQCARLRNWHRIELEDVQQQLNTKTAELKTQEESLQKHKDMEATMEALDVLVSNLEAERNRQNEVNSQLAAQLRDFEQTRSDCAQTLSAIDELTHFLQHRLTDTTTDVGRPMFSLGTSSPSLSRLCQVVQTYVDEQLRVSADSRASLASVESQLRCLIADKLELQTRVRATLGLDTDTQADSSGTATVDICAQLQLVCKANAHLQRENDELNKRFTAAKDSADMCREKFSRLALVYKDVLSMQQQQQQRRPKSDVNKVDCGITTEPKAEPP